MTKQTEALKLALEALEANKYALASPFGSPDSGERKVQELKQNAVIALRQAIEQAEQASPPRQPLTEHELAKCLAKAGCIGTIKMSFESGPYDIDRPSLNATKLCRAIEAAHGIKENT